MYNIIFKRKGYDEETIIENVSDDNALSALKELVKDNKQSKYNYLFNFKPGDICVYTSDENKAKFVLTKVWVENLTCGYFNAVYADGDVIIDGTLELITKVGSIRSTFDGFIDALKSY